MLPSHTPHVQQLGFCFTMAAHSKLQPMNAQSHQSPTLCPNPSPLSGTLQLSPSTQPSTSHTQTKLMASAINSSFQFLTTVKIVP